MLRIFANSIDITEDVIYGSVTIKEQLNNRSNICSFKTIDKKVNEWEEIRVYECMELVRQASSWQPTIYVDDTYEYFELFKVDQELVLDFEWVNELVTIQSIDQTQKSITFYANLQNTHTKWTFIGRNIFWWSADKNPDSQFGSSEKLEYSVSCSDYSTVFNRQLVVETFQDQYMRQIFWLVVYEFCANDDQVDIDLFESAWTESWVALAMQDELVDKIQWTKCQKTGTTWAGTAVRTKTLWSPIDISTMDDVRLWHKIWENYGIYISSIKYRVGNDSSNYYERSSVRVWLDHEDCRNFENFKIWKPDIAVGTIDESAIERLQIEIVATDTIPLWEIKFDHSLATEWGITLKNCIRGFRKFADIRSQYKKPSVLVEDICKLQGIFRFVDYAKDLNVFRNNGTPAPWTITDSSKNFDEMSLSIDMSMLKNRQTVRWWEAPMTFRYVQDSYTDWLMESRPLDYKPKDLLMFVAYQDKAISGITWLAWVATVTTSAAHGLVDGDEVAITDVGPNGYNGSYTIYGVTGWNTFKVDIAVNPGAYSSGWFVGIFQAKTVGIENLNDAALFDFLMNFNEKIVKKAAIAIPPKWSVIRRDYNPYQPIRIRMSHGASIAAMKLIGWGNGIFDGAVISDSNILTYEDARMRAKAELDAYANPQMTLTFTTEKAWLKAGQVISVQDTTRNINQDFLIQMIQRKSKKWAIATYQVTCGSTMFGLTEFFQLLLKKATDSQIDVFEMIDVIVNQDETISIRPIITTEKRNGSYLWSLNKKRIDFIYNVGIRTAWLGRIPHTDPTKKNPRYWDIAAGVTATIQFETASDYNTQAGLSIDITSYSGSPTGLYAQAFSLPIPVTPNTDYVFGVWIENLLADGIVWWQGLTIEVKEYTSHNWLLTQITNLVTNRNVNQDSTHDSVSFTTDPATTHIVIEITLLESTGKVTIHEMYIQEVWTESVTDPWVVDFCEVTP